MTLYYMHGDEFRDEKVIVDLKRTSKQIVITPISPKPRFTNGCIDKLWDDGKIVIREPNPKTHRICRHYLEVWGDGDYTLYPDRAGLPYRLSPKETK